MTAPLYVFAIETSCDETATAVVEARSRTILAQHVYSQYAEHAPYGGIIPELASRAHLERLPQLAEATIRASGLAWNQLDAVAATVGPGLTTALLIGSTFAKSLALGLNKPFIPTNHIEGHALSPLLADAALNPPYLLLLVSGGHCQLVMVSGVGQYQQLGTTLDDAVGEAFDKVGKLLSLPHPAGPAMDKLALSGNPAAVPLPFPKNDASLDFSFAGLKTAVKDHLAAHPETKPEDIAAAFQAMCVKILSKKAGNALRQTGAKHLVAAGGVAANSAIRAALMETAATHGAAFTAPPLAYCTDNAVMIALTAGLRHIHGLTPVQSDALAARAIPRWPLAEMNMADIPPHQS